MLGKHAQKSFLSSLNEAKEIECFSTHFHLQVPRLEVDIRDGAMMTALMWASFHGRTEQVRVLIEKGADPSARDMDGMSAVHWSVQRHDTRVLQVCIPELLALFIVRLLCCVNFCRCSSMLPVLSTLTVRGRQ